MNKGLAHKQKYICNNLS